MYGGYCRVDVVGWILQDGYCRVDIVGLERVREG